MSRKTTYYGASSASGPVADPCGSAWQLVQPGAYIDVGDLTALLPTSGSIFLSAWIRHAAVGTPILYPFSFGDGSTGQSTAPPTSSQGHERGKGTGAILYRMDRRRAGGLRAIAAGHAGAGHRGGAMARHRGGYGERKNKKRLCIHKSTQILQNTLITRPDLSCRSVTPKKESKKERISLIPITPC